MSRLWARVPPWVVNVLIIPIVSVVLGFLVAAIAVVATGADPTLAYLDLFQGAFTNNNAFAETLVSSVPYIFLGLGVALGFRAGLFNIGAEGQFYIGALAGSSSPTRSTACRRSSRSRSPCWRRWRPASSTPASPAS